MNSPVTLIKEVLQSVFLLLIAGASMGVYLGVAMWLVRVAR